MRELAGMVTDLCGSDSRLEFRPLPADDPRQRRPDITRAHELLGWQPTIPLAEGLRPTIEYFRRFVDAPRKDSLHPDGDQSRSGVGGEQRRE